MSKSIRLHPKHGLNPTMPVCTWCGEPTGEIALLGAAYKGEAPMHMAIDREPCAACQARMAEGITIIEADEVNGKPVTTGCWCVMKEEALTRVFEGSVVEAVLKVRRCYLTTDAWTQLGLPRENMG